MLRSPSRSGSASSSLDGLAIAAMFEVNPSWVLASKATMRFTISPAPSPASRAAARTARSGNDWRIADIDWDSGNLRSAFRRKAAYTAKRCLGEAVAIRPHAWNILTA